MEESDSDGEPRDVDSAEEEAQIEKDEPSFISSSPSFALTGIAHAFV